MREKDNLQNATTIHREQPRICTDTYTVTHIHRVEKEEGPVDYENLFHKTDVLLPNFQVLMMLFSSCA